MDRYSLLFNNKKNSNFSNTEVVLQDQKKSFSVNYGDGVINSQGPTSRHILIAGPNGHRTMIPLRSLKYNIIDNENNTSSIQITMSTKELEYLKQDIEAGFRRVNYG